MYEPFCKTQSLLSRCALPNFPFALNKVSVQFALLAIQLPLDCFPPILHHNMKIYKRASAGRCKISPGKFWAMGVLNSRIFPRPYRFPSSVSKTGNCSIWYQEQLFWQEIFLLYDTVPQLQAMKFPLKGPWVLKDVILHLQVSPVPYLTVKAACSLSFCDRSCQV